jgi:2-succinyl-5-enolpyruvyl-6-hydroxy-3-cyclohexene-1-carboxylate synthase
VTGAIVGEWARLLFGCLAQAGVKDCIVSPGSRSTPFAWAAAGTPGLRCHSLLDERSAAFFALGLARVTGEPALLLCTSGSAAANYFPAVVEASLARVPLLVMTADRPLELQDTGAPQTIDQVKIYGDFARSFFDLGLPDPASLSLAALGRVVAQAVFASKSPVPGPVQLNARARKPLEPSPAHTEHEHAVAAEVSRLLARGVPRTFVEKPRADARGIEALAERLRRAERRVLIVGPLPLYGARDAAPIAELARKLDVPLAAEATSQLRFASESEIRLSLDGIDWLLRVNHPRTGLRPDLVLTFGAPPVSAGVERLLAARGPTELCVVAEHGFPDPTSSASIVVHGAPGEVSRRLLEALAGYEPSAPQSEYRDLVVRANGEAWSAVDRVLGAAPFGEPHAVRAALEAIPRGGLLVVGNSLPVREVDAFVRASGRGIGVVCQRGANGIDGVISGAAGTAHASRKPTLLLVGDVSFVHDLGGLVAARRAETPLVIAVLDNGGGRIFEHLPAARLFRERPEIRDLWLTPPEIAFDHAVGAFGLPYSSARGLAELETALRDAFAREGASVVHVSLPPDSSREAFAAVFRGLGEGASG